MSPIRLPKLPRFTSPFTKARGQRPASRSRQPLKFRSLLIDPLEERHLLSAIGDDKLGFGPLTTDLRINETYNSTTTMIAGQSMATDNDGDFVVVWARQDLMPDENTGALTVSDWNIYARYFTDEVQRITLPTAVLDNAQPTVNAKFTLRYGGTKAVERISFSSSYQPETTAEEQIPIKGDFTFSFNGTDFTVPYNEANGAESNRQALLTALQGIASDPSCSDYFNRDSDGDSKIDLDVQPISATEFEITFSASDSLVNAGSHQPLFTWTDISNTDLTKNYFAATVERVREPFLLESIPVVPGNPAKTAANIQYAFSQYSSYTVSVVPVLTATQPTFDITFTGDSGKQNHPQMSIPSVLNEYGTEIGGGSVTTLKETSPEFRVNAPETPDPDTMWNDYMAQTKPAVAIDADGDFVITWEGAVSQTTTPGSVSDIFARRFSPVGYQANPDFTYTVYDPTVSTTTPLTKKVYCVEPLGSEFRVNTTTTNAQTRPALAMDNDGNFAIAWASMGQSSSYTNSILGQRFNRDGDRLGNEIVINTPDTNEHFDPAVAVSSDGYFAVTWTTELYTAIPVGMTYYRANLVIGSPEGALVQRSVIGQVALETNCTFDDLGNLLVTWTESTKNQMDQDPGKTTVESTGIRGMYYSLFDADGNLSVQVQRDVFRINSPDWGSPPWWAWDQFGSQPLLDADGDIVVTYSGYGCDMDNISDGEMTADAWIDQELAWYQKKIDAAFIGKNGYSGPTLYRMLAKARVQLEALYSSYNGEYAYQDGEASGALFNMIDANNFTPDTSTYYHSDEALNELLDGQNTRYYLAFPDTITGGSYSVTVNGEEVDVSPVFTDKVFDAEKTRKAIRNALRGLPFAGISYYDSPSNPDYGDGPIDVRLVSTDEITSRAGTYWQISGVDSTDFCFEITFVGSLHDLDVTVAPKKNDLEAEAIEEVQTMTFTPATNSGYFRLQMVSNGETLTTGDIYFTPNSGSAMATAIQTALMNLTLADGTTKPYSGLEVAAVNGYTFTLTYGGDSGGVDQSEPQFVTASSTTGRLQANIAVSEDTKGRAESSPDPVLLDYIHGSIGTIQSYVSSGIEPDGDFTAVWMQYNNSDSSDPVFFTGYGNTNYLDTDFYSDANLDDPNIYFRVFDESTDTAGPLVTDFLLADGSRLKTGGQVNATMQYLVVTFDEEMMTSGLYNVTDPANWALLKDGVEVIGGIQSIQFGMNMAAYIGATDPLSGLDTAGSNKWEAVLKLDGNGATDGTPALADGHYQVVAKNVLRDVAGNPLRYTGVDTDGAVYERAFDVLAPSTGEQLVNTTVTGNQTTNDSSPQTVASNANGDYVIVWTTPGTGVYARVYRTTWTNNNGLRTSNSVPVKEILVSANATASYASVAMDADGDFAVTWSQQDAGNWNVYARRFNAVGEAQQMGGRTNTNAIQVNTETADIQRNSTVAMDADGDFVVTWQSNSQDGSGYGIYAKRFNPQGYTVGGVNEVQVLNFANQFRGTFTLQYEGKTSAAITFSGNAFDTTFLTKLQAALVSVGADAVAAANSYSTVNLTFKSEGNKSQITLGTSTLASGSTGQVQLSTRIEGVDAEFLVNDTTTGNQRSPSVDMSDDGDFVISWTSSGQGGDSAYQTNIYAKRFFSNDVITGGTASVAAVSTSTTQTSTVITKGQVADCMTTVDDPGNHVTSPGIGYDGVVEVDLYDSYGNWMGGGSGTLLTTGMHVLTAAHVVCAEDLPELATENVTVTFDLADGKHVYSVSDIYVNPNFTGDALAGGDLAVLVLESPAPTSVDRYDIYRSSDELGRVFDLVGYGISGTGETGADPLAYDFGTKRNGQNRFEIISTNAYPGADDDGLGYDFDDGTTTYDTIGAWAGIRDLGLGTSEVCCARGDSGGPAFIDGKIAGVTSYVVYSGAESSFGSVGVSVRVSQYTDWIDQTLRSGAAEFLVNQTTADNQMWSAVALDAQGNFVVSWTSYDQDGVGDGPGGSSNGLNGIFARRFDSKGIALSDEFQVNTYSAGNQQHSSISMDADGDFTVVWESFQDRPLNPSTTTDPDAANSYGIYAQRYARTALLGTSTFLGPHGELGSEMAINTTKSGNQRYPGVAMDATGDFVIAWSGNGTVTGQVDSQGVFYTRFPKPKDDTGPTVTDVYNVVSPTEFETVPEAAMFTEDVEKFKIVFSEQLNVNAGSMYSVTNLSNWQLTRDGQVVSGAVAKVEFAFNTTTGKYEALVTFDSDLTKAGYDALGEGTYILTIRDRVQDLFKNNLDGNDDGIAGGNFTRSFSIGVGLLPVPDGPSIPGATDEDVPVSNNEFWQQDSVAVASNANGDYVLVWVDYALDGYYGDIRAQRFDRFGQKQGNEFYVNSYQTGVQITPDVAMDDFGNFVITWAGQGIGADKVVEDSGIFARVYNSTGVALGDQFRVNNYRIGKQITPAVAMNSTGNFIVTWSGQGSTSELSGVYGHLFDALGQSKSSDFQINTYTDGGQTTPDVAADANGNFVVVWTSNGKIQDGSSSGVYGRRYNAAGTALSSEFRVNNYTTNSQFDPAVAMDADGDFVVAYTSLLQDGSGYGVYARRYNKAGTAVDNEVIVNQTTANSQMEPAVAMDDSGKYIVSWTTYGQDNYDKLGYQDSIPEDKGIYARIFNADGTSYKYDLNGDGTAEAMGEFRVNATTTGDQTFSAVTMDADGDLVVAWQGPDESLEGVYQRVIVLNPSTYLNTGGTTGGSGSTSLTAYSVEDPRTPIPLTTAAPVTPSVTLALKGTSGNDIFEFQAGATNASWVVKVNGVVQAIAANVAGITFDGLAGTDTVRLTGLDSNETAVIKPTYASLTGNGFSVSASNVESFVVNANGGNDALYLYDSASDDLLTVKPGTITLSGGYSATAYGFETLDVYAISGGYDTLNLYDTPEFDYVTMTPTKCTQVGGGYTFRVNGFERVNAVASTGNDKVVMTGSTGNDTFQVNTIWAFLSGANYALKASSFKTVYAAGNGGTDSAALAGAADSKDTLTAAPQKARMVNPTANYDWTSIDFSTITAYGGAGGNDVATLNDSAGDDTFISYPTTAVLRGTGYSITVNQFEDVGAYSTGSGNDNAVFFDSAGDDLFYALASYARMCGTGFYLHAHGFDNVTGIASTGKDIAALEGTSGADTFRLTKGVAQMSGGGLTKNARWFDEVYFLGGDGNDTATVYDSAELIDASLLASLRSKGVAQIGSFKSIETIQFRKTTDATYKKDVTPVDQVFTYWN